jgi:hypothetical protein
MPSCSALTCCRFAFKFRIASFCSIMIFLRSVMSFTTSSSLASSATPPTNWMSGFRLFTLAVVELFLALVWAAGLLLISGLSGIENVADPAHSDRKVFRNRKKICRRSAVKIQTDSKPPSHLSSLIYFFFPVPFRLFFPSFLSLLPFLRLVPWCVSFAPFLVPQFPFQPHLK